MLSLEMLDVAIGMVFTFLLLSLICTALVEILEKYLKYRATDLENGIKELFQATVVPKITLADKGILLKLTVEDKKKLVKELDNKNVIIISDLSKDEKAIFLKDLTDDEKSKIDNAIEKFGSSQIVRTLYQHSLIASLYRGPYEPESKKLPSYIPASNFAIALLDIVLPGTPTNLSGSAGGGDAVHPTANPMVNLRTAINNLPYSLKNALLPLVDAAGNNVDNVRANIENWYNTSMDRVSGWYKRRTQGFLIAIGVMLAAAMNADTFAIYKSLINDAPLRNALVAASAEYAKANPKISDTTKTPEQRVKDNVIILYNLRLPIGWDWDTAVVNKKAKDPVKKAVTILAKADTSKKATDTNYNFITNRKLALPWQYTNNGGEKALLIFLKLIGWLITALAISLGAPFWFDTLNKIMVIRSTVKPHEKSQEEDSEDRKKPKSK